MYMSLYAYIVDSVEFDNANVYFRRFCVYMK